MNSSETVISKKNFEHGIKWKMPSLQILTYVWNKFKSISRIKVKAIVSIFGSKKYRHIPDTAHQIQATVSLYSPSLYYTQD